MTTNEYYINRTFLLAKRGGKATAPNPNVGAVLVHNERIIGEGYHRIFGGPHAEVDCLQSVSVENKSLISESTLYVSLEPCCHHGKTPPCTSLIIDHKIPRVVISTPDPHPLVQGKGISILRENRVDVRVGILEEKGRIMIEKFIANSIYKRPFITIKMAVSKDGFMGVKEKSVWLSNEFSRLWSHKLRSEHEGILVGSETVIMDNPSLTTRLYPGENPVRILLDRRNRVAGYSNIFNNEAPTFHISKKGRSGLVSPNLSFAVDSESFLQDVMDICYANKVYSVIVEGGSTIIKAFLENELWDQAYIIRTPVKLNDGIPAPVIKGDLEKGLILIDNEILCIRPHKSSTRS